MELVAALSDSKCSIPAPADFLIRHALQEFAKQGVRKCLALTRFSGFGTARQQRPSLTPEQYLAEESDATVNWHIQRGAKVVGLRLNARPVDVENDGCIVEMEYSLTLQRLIVAVQGLLGGSSGSLDVDKSLFALDLSSMDLVELRQVLVSDFGAKDFSVASFFRFPSVRALASHLDSGLSAASYSSLQVCSNSSQRPALHIVGSSSVVAGSRDVCSDLVAGKDLIRCAPKHRLELTGKGGLLLGGFVDDLGFDASFFNISPREVSHNNLLFFFFMLQSHS